MLSLDEILFEQECHVYRYKGRVYPSVTQVIQLAGLGDDFSMVNAERMEYAQRRGRLVHMACEYLDNDELDMATVDESIRGYVEGYVKFRQEVKIKVVAVEQKMVSVDLGLAGTPDLICFIGGLRSVVDRKTAQHMSKAVGLQTAGYALLWNQQHPNTPVHRRYGLRLEKEGDYKLVPNEDPDDGPAFMDAIAAARSAKRMEPWKAKYAKR